MPVALLLIEATDPRRRLGLRAALAALAPQGAVLLVGAAAALASPTYRALLATSLDARSLLTNLRTQADAVVYLGGQLVRLDRLNADPLLAVRQAWTPGLALEATALIALVAAGFACLRTRPGLAFGVLWFFLWLAPTNSLLPRLDVANDRQLYLASVGPAWLLVTSAARFFARRGVMLAAVLGLGLVLGVATGRRNAVYASEIALAEGALPDVAAECR